jgi:hypothetical protein
VFSVLHVEQRETKQLIGDEDRKNLTLKTNMCETVIVLLCKLVSSIGWKKIFLVQITLFSHSAI